MIEIETGGNTHPLTSLKPRLLIISAVLPFPRVAGQQQRVFYKIRAARNDFHITFLTTGHSSQIEQYQEQLLSICDEAIILPSKYLHSWLSRVWYRIAGFVFTLRTGLKFSNYLASKVEFTPKRIKQICNSLHFDCVLYEYWHAYESTAVFHQKDIPCVLDMHDILWRSYERQLSKNSIWRRYAVRKYRTMEENAWKQFDALIAINREEGEYAATKLGNNNSILYAPMGTDLELWSFNWRPASPPRIAYYGGLGSTHNQQDALRSYENIMPYVWNILPNVELWIVGSKPPQRIQALASDPRVRVTGYVEDIQSVLGSMSLILCPWSGTYGFRSRLIEAMALGVPVVATSDAIFGMDMHLAEGIFTAETDQDLAYLCIKLLQQPDYLSEQSMLARAQIENNFSYETTYGRLSQDLLQFVHDFASFSSLPTQ